MALDILCREMYEVERRRDWFGFSAGLLISSFQFLICECLLVQVQCLVLLLFPVHASVYGTFLRAHVSCSHLFGALCAAEEYKTFGFFLGDNFSCSRIHRNAWFAVDTRIASVSQDLWTIFPSFST